MKGHRGTVARRQCVLVCACVLHLAVSGLSIESQANEANTDPLIERLRGIDAEDRANAATELGRREDSRATQALSLATRDGDARVRSAAAWALGKIDDEETIEPLLAGLSDAELDVRRNFVEALGAKKGDSRVLARLTQLISVPSLRGVAVGALRGTSDPSIVAPVVQALNDEDADVRFLAIDALGAVRDDAAVAGLQQALADARPVNRMAAASELGFLASRNSIPALMKATRDSNAEVRAAAAEALGSIADPLSVKTLISLVQDLDPDVRAGAVKALGQIGERGAVSALVGSLTDPKVRADALEALRKIGGVQVGGKALYVEDYDGPRGSDLALLQKRLAITEERLDAVDELGALSDPRAVDLLSSQLHDADPLIRGTAVLALGKIGDPRADDWLVAVASDPDATVGMAALVTLGKIGDPHAIDLLIAQLHNPDGYIAGRVAEALGESGDSRATGALIALLGDSRHEVRAGAAQGLGDLGNAKAVVPLTHLLSDGNSRVRAHAAAALGKIGDGYAVEFLVKLLSDPDPSVAGAVADALGSLNDPRAVEPLIERLQTGDALTKDLKRSTARALGNLKDPRAVGPLADLAHDADHDIWASAIAALGKTGNPLAVDFLLSQLSSSDPKRRAGAARALVSVKDPRLLRPLITSLDDKNPDVQRYAAKALGNIGDTEAVASLVSLVDASELVRDAAADSLHEIGDSQTVSLVVSLMKRNQPWEREDAVRLLARLDGTTSVPLLVQSLSDSSPDVRSAAAETLGEKNDLRAVEPLIPLLKDPFCGPRAAAVTALGKLADTRAARPMAGAIYGWGSDTWWNLDATSWVRSLARVEALDQPGVVERIEVQPALAFTAIKSALHYQKALPMMVYVTATRGSYLRQQELLGEIALWDGQRAEVESRRLDEDLREYEQRFGQKFSTNSFVDLFVARLKFASGAYQEAIRWSQLGLAHAAADDVALRTLLTCEEIEARRQLKELLATQPLVSSLEQSLLPHLSIAEEVRLRYPLSGYALLMDGLAQSDAGQQREASDTLYRAQDAVTRLEHLDGTNKSVSKRVTLLIAGLHGGITRQESVVLSRVAADGYALAPPDTGLAKESLRNALLILIKEAMSRADTEGYEEAQRLSERLSLLELPPLGSGGVGGHAREEASKHVQEAHARLERIDAELSRGKDTPARGRTSNRSPEEMERLQDQRTRAAADYRINLQKLTAQYPYLGTRFTNNPRGIQELQRQLRANERVVQYVVLDDGGVAFVVDQSSIQMVRLSFNPAELASAVTAFRELLAGQNSAPRGMRVEPPRDNGSSDLRRKIGQQLAQWLVTPLHAYLEHATAVTLVPSGPLFLLPFAALPVGDRFWVEEVDLRILNTASMLAAVLPIGPQQQPKFIALANPTSPPWPPLRGAEAEVIYIKDHYFKPGSAETHVGPDARSSWLVGRDLSGAVVHLAVHARVGSIGETELILTGDTLKLSDVQHLKLEQSPLVVLSACSTGVGEQLSGGEVASLSEAFIDAGSRAVLATLWPIDDDGAGLRDFMAAFYEERIHGDAFALAAAQRRLITERKPPSVWAAFRLTGGN